MDRHLKIFAKKGYLFAEIRFRYGVRKKVTATLTEHRLLYESEDADTGEITYSTYELSSRELPYVSFRQFRSMEELKQHDIDFAKQELRSNDMGNVADYNFEYGDETQQARYFIGHNHQNYIMGVADVSYNFKENTKRVKFLSGQSLKWDSDIESNCLESNLDLIGRIPLYDQNNNEWDPAFYDIKTVDTVIQA